MKTQFSSLRYAEPHPIFYKDSERQAQRQMKIQFSSLRYAEPHPIFYKDSERRTLCHSTLRRGIQRILVGGFSSPTPTGPRIKCGVTSAHRVWGDVILPSPKMIKRTMRFLEVFYRAVMWKQPCRTSYFTKHLCSLRRSYRTSPKRMRSLSEGTKQVESVML